MDSVVRTTLMIGAMLSTAAIPNATFAENPPTTRTDARPYVQGLAPSRWTMAQVTFADVVKRVSPSVVTIYSSKQNKVGPRNSSSVTDPMLRHFLGEDDEELPRGRNRGERSLGSGVIVSSDGYILSNNHVIEGSDDIRVRLADGRTDISARLIGTDPPTDIAVLKIDRTNLTSMSMTDSDKLQVGDLVLAVGNPFDVGQTVTMGIVSAVGRGGFGVVDYEDFIQTDASINPGNSGGALIDAEGKLVGINTFILSGGLGNVGIGFAVPSNMAKGVMERIIADGRVVRGFLGLFVQPITPELARAFHLDKDVGALIGSITTTGPADQAGLHDGDVITEFNGRKVNDARHLRLLAALARPNTKVNIGYLREGKEHSTTVTLGEIPRQTVPEVARRKPSSIAKGEPFKGVEVTDLDPKTRKQFELPTDVKGAFVLQVEPGSSAYHAGLRPGDIILELNRQKIRDAREAIDLGKRMKDGRALLRVWSKGSAQFLALENALAATRR